MVAEQAALIEPSAPARASNGGFLHSFPVSYRRNGWRADIRTGIMHPSALILLGRISCAII